MNEMTAFLPEELTGGFFRDVIIGRVKDYLRDQWEAVQKAIDTGDLSSLDAIIGQLADVISGAIGGRVSAKTITAFILSGGDVWEEWVRSGLIRTSATAGGVPVRASVIHNDLGAYREDVAAFLFATSAPAEPNPEFGFMEAIAIGGFLLNLFRTWREKRNK